ncbi:GtrA family protein [Actinotalea sp. JY-7885]|nr:GtrA family protein [Actinotalea sp. JY-7885]
MPLAGRLRRVSRHARVRELARFGSVGGAAYVVDVTVFNLLLLGPGELLADKPLTAKVVASLVATLASWVGNRYWAFAGGRTSRPVRELVLFLGVNGLGAAAAVATLAVSRYVLGLTSPLADNIAANVVGVALGTALRYVCYRWLVFTGPAHPADAAGRPVARAAPDPTR